RPEVTPVGGGTSQCRTKMLVAHRECIRKSVVKRYILPLVVAHSQGNMLEFFVTGPLGVDPTVIFALVESVYLVFPRMRHPSHPGGFGILHVQPKRRKGLPILSVLEPHFSAVGQLDGAGIIKAPNALQH